MQGRREQLQWPVLPASQRAPLPQQGLLRQVLPLHRTGRPQLQQVRGWGRTHRTSLLRQAREQWQWARRQRVPWMAQPKSRQLGQEPRTFRQPSPQQLGSLLRQRVPPPQQGLLQPASPLHQTYRPQQQRARPRAQGHRKDQQQRVQLQLRERRTNLPQRVWLRARACQTSLPPRRQGQERQTSLPQRVRALWHRRALQQLAQELVSPQTQLRLGRERSHRINLLLAPALARRTPLWRAHRTYQQLLAREQALQEQGHRRMLALPLAQVPQTLLALHSQKLQQQQGQAHLTSAAAGRTKPMVWNEVMHSEKSVMGGIMLLDFLFSGRPILCAHLHQRHHHQRQVWRQQLVPPRTQSRRQQQVPAPGLRQSQKSQPRSLEQAPPHRKQQVPLMLGHQMGSQQLQRQQQALHHTDTKRPVGRAARGARRRWHCVQSRA